MHNNNLKKFINDKDKNGYNILILKQKKMEDRFCNLNKSVFDINKTIEPKPTKDEDWLNGYMEEEEFKL